MRTTTVPARGGPWLAAGLALLALCAGSAAAQAGFRVMHSVSGTTPTHVEVTGTVVNESRVEAGDVSVTVEALDAGGKVLARGITYVARRIPEGASAPFTAKVPATTTAVSYRAVVTSYRYLQPYQAP